MMVQVIYGNYQLPPDCTAGDFLTDDYGKLAGMIEHIRHKAAALKGDLAIAGFILDRETCRRDETLRAERIELAMESTKGKTE